MACSTSYSKNIICAIHNVITMNDHAGQELLRAIDINELINQHKMSQKVVLSSSIDRHLTSVMPFTNVCTNMNCQGQSWDIAFSRASHIAHFISMEPCSIYADTCRRCKYVYGPSSILDSHKNQRISTTQSVQNVDYIYFSGDLVYSRQLLAMFSNSLIHTHTIFQGFTESYISTLVDLDANQTSIYSANTFAKTFRDRLAILRT